MKNMIQHPQFGEIRTEKKNGEFIFCAQDIADALDIVNANRATNGLDDDEKLTYKICTSGQNREMLFVTESGLYALIIRSNKPAARKFRKWITSEVLPALRKYGTYSMDEKVMDRAKAKAERKIVFKMLHELDESLSQTDRRIVARQCQTDEDDVYRVLAGQMKDASMLSLCFAKATSNAVLNKMFYTHEGAEKVLQELNLMKR